MTPARILVIDDSTADIGLLRLALDNNGEPYELQVLSTGRQALDFVQEHRSGLREPEPCLILLDLHLPQYDGLQILREIKVAPALAHIHVMVLSGLASPAERREIASLDAHYRQKPSTLTEFLKIGEAIIEICRGPKASVVSA